MNTSPQNGSCPGKVEGDPAWTPGAVLRCLPNEGVSRVCPVCRDEGRKPEAIYVSRPGKLGEWLLVRFCPSCESHFYDPLQLTGDGLPESRAALDFYIEVGAGVNVMAELLCQLPVSKGASMLEVGCGYGYSLDFWQRQLGGTALGIEPGFRGQIGAEELGVDIVSLFLTPESKLPGANQSFDVVSSMEVIEHVEDAGTFIALLALYLKPDGILILTTPNSESLREPNTATSDLYATLSPGYHTFLLSEKTLGKLLREQGFEHLVFQSCPIQLKVFASRQPFQLKPPGPESTEAYLSYNRRLVQAAAPGSPLHRGACFRNLLHEVNAGNWEAAAQARARMEASLAAAYGAEVNQGEERLRRAREIFTFEDFPSRLPTFAFDYDYLLGLYTLQVDGDVSQALRHFETAGKIAAIFAKIPALLIIAGPGRVKIRYEKAQALLRMEGDACRRGLRILKCMAKGGKDGTVSRDWRRRAFLSRLRHFVLAGNWKFARGEMGRLEAFLAESETNGLTADEALWHLFCHGHLALSAAVTHQAAFEWFSKLAAQCEALAPAKGSHANAVAADLYRNARFHIGLASEYVKEVDRAKQEYEWLVSHPTPVIGLGENMEAWARRARNRLERLAKPPAEG